MRYLIGWIFWVVLAVIVGFLGNSKREEKRVDPNKTVMRQVPMYRFGMYSIGVILIGLFGFFGAGAIHDEAQKENPWLIPVIFLGFFAGILCFLAGYILYAKHIFFDEKELIVGRPFRSNLSFLWQEIERMEISGNYLCLYGAGGKRIVKANPALENYDLFADMAKRMCSAKQIKQSGGDWKNGERSMVRRAAAYIIFGTAIFLLICIFILGKMGDYELAKMFTRPDMTVFRIALILAIAIFLYGIWLYLDRIRYTKNEIIFSTLFSKKRFSWRELKKVRRAKVGTMEVEMIFLTFQGKEYRVNSAKYRQEYQNFFDFIIDLALTQGIPTENL